jgi:hypothetical protein
MPVVLATQDIVIRRIRVQRQPRTNSFQDPISKKTHDKKRAGGMAQVVKLLA